MGHEVQSADEKPILPLPGGEPTEKHGHRCREAVDLAIRAFLDLLDKSVSSEIVAVETVRRIALAVTKAEGALSHYYDHHSSGCVAFFELVKSERQRTDYFGRIITEPLVPLLNDLLSGIHRKNLPQFFLAIRMILGDDIYAEYKDRCIRIANALRGEHNLLIWPDFFADAQSQEIMQATQVAIARSFKRFAPRKDWFLIVMNTDPHAISLGSTMFLPKDTDEKLEQAFNELHFVRLFRALFSAVHPDKFDEPEAARFQSKFSLSPKALFGPFFVELSVLEQHATALPKRPKSQTLETRKIKKK